MGKCVTMKNWNTEWIRFWSWLWINIYVVRFHSNNLACTLQHLPTARTGTNWLKRYESVNWIIAKLIKKMVFAGHFEQTCIAIVSAFPLLSTNTEIQIPKLSRNFTISKKIKKKKDNMVLIIVLFMHHPRTSSNLSKSSLSLWIKILSFCDTIIAFLTHVIMGTYWYALASVFYKSGTT